MATGIREADESWFLRVVDRISSGQTLYRDVFFPSTPLSVYATRAVTSVAGEQILVVMGLGVICFVVSALLTCLVARQLGMRGLRLVLVGAVSFVLMPPLPDALYTPFASALFLACLSATLAWMRHGGAVWLAVAGTTASATFASKQTVGLCALAALLVAIVVERDGWAVRRGRVGGLTLALAAFALTSLVLLAPVWLSGGGQKFLDYGFFGHGDYARLGARPYLHELAAGFRLLDPVSLGGVKAAGSALPILLLPVIALAALVGALRRGERKQHSTIAVVAAFGAAAFTGAYPRYEPPHLAYAAGPLLATIVAWAALRPIIPPRWVRGAIVLVIVWTVGSTSIMLGSRIVKIADGKLRTVGLAHFSGAFADPHERPNNAAAAALAAVPGHTVFIVSPDAGFYYLVSGVRNPTPFDIPGTTAFGQVGKRDVIRALRRGAIPMVCLAPPSAWTEPRELPLWLVRAVQQEFVRGADLQICKLYHLRSAAPS